ncbi:MAG TPA: DUF3159 domain-containing protein [Microbacteriaceae bacterium]|nr:DUF3159 domain-containing protein [Microbacteriaceae bacterium]
MSADGPPERPGRTGLGALTPGEVPTRAALWQAIGGMRGLLESILPGLAFLVLYAVTKDTWLSVIPPVIIAAAFLLVRLVQRQSPLGALGGFLIVVVSAASALLTGNANDNFLPGLWVNGLFLVAMLVSLLVRWPFVGLVYGVLTGDPVGWRQAHRVRRAAIASTWLWAALFAARLIVELPLYFAEQTEALALAKLLMGIPLYAATLWLTWLLLRRQAAPAEEPREAN